MKCFYKIAFILILGLASMQSYGQIVPPYLEDFEGGDGTWISSGAFNSWEWGVPVSGYISNSAPCDGGQNAWVTNLSGEYNDDEQSYLTSPQFDFSGLTSDPVLAFQHIYITESCCDQGWVEYSIDGGVTWLTIGTAGTGQNWYNDFSDYWNDQSAAGPGNWQTASNVLAGTAGESNVMIRFVFESDGSVTEDGFGVDNISITEAFETVGVVAMSSPISGCGLTSTETIEVDILNSGSSTVNSFNICYSLDGGTPVCEMASITIAPGSAETYTFSSTADLSIPGLHTLAIYTNLLGDVYACDDTLFASIESQPYISVFPYFENFESGSGGWISNGINNSWGLGAQTGTFVYGANECGSGSTSWGTNISGAYNNDEYSFVESPCLDFSGLTTDPVLVFDHIYITESCCDQGWVEYSIDGGLSWSTLGTAGSGQNWYNDFSDYWNDQSGGPGSWQSASNVLTGLAGESNVKIRMVFESDGSVVEDGFGFDNVLISDGFENAKPVALISPVSGCGLGSAEIVEVEIANTGLTTINSIEVCYSLNSGTPVCETASITIASGGTANYTFLIPVDLSASGTHTLDIYTNLTGDAYACDDTASYSIESQPTISSFPYSEDFESGSGGWLTYGVNNSWQLGTPNASYIPSTDPCDGGNNAWVTNLSGIYNDDELSYVESPCFDFSTLTSDPVLVFDHIYITESCCDEGWIEYSIDGGLTWNTVGTSGTGQNWYNDFSDYWNDASAGGAGEWQIAYNDLTGLAGESSVRFRFVFQTDGSVGEEGFGVDNIRIIPSVVLDMAADSIGYTAACSYSNNEAITGHFYNHGSIPVTSLEVCYTVNGGTPTCETIGAIILPASVYSYTFVTPADLSMNGNYDIVVYINDANDIDKCDDSTMTTIVHPYKVNLIDSVLCAGTDLVLNSNIIDATYDWSTGETTASIIVSAAGQYYVDVTDNATGCLSTDTVEVTETDLLLVAVGTNEMTGNDGMIDLTLSNGTAPYSYNWSNSAITEDLSGLAAGNYEVIVTDANGCMDSVSVSLISEVGIEETDLTKSFSVYPNPFSNEVYVTSFDAYALGELRDASGRIVTTFEVAINTQRVLNLSELERGVYYLSLFVDGEILITKLVKQ